MIIFWIILWIIAIAFVIGVVAVISDIIVGTGKNHKPYGPYERFIKRGLDAFLVTGALIVLSPVLLIISLLVRIKLGSPVLFSQERPGKDEKIFKLYKFRSMTNEKDENGNLLPNEKRLTSFGRKLRSTSLDELPELLNIAKGDMSIIGPRPLLIRYLPAYTDEEKHRHDVRPGLTGLAQINGRNFVKWDQRLAFDVEYVKHITFAGDAKIFFKTILKVFKHDDIAENPDDIDEGFLDEIRGVTQR
jgi:undecaprenyl phosphate N,N'-diacetylbacillosamine 1-phosphate transferase